MDAKLRRRHTPAFSSVASDAEHQPALEEECKVEHSSRHNVWWVPIALFAMALGVRLYEISSPAEVVFDEVHFGKFAAYYMTRQLIVALGAWLAGFDGTFEFDSIGDKYSETSVPFREMRAFIALIGSLQIPLVYEIMRETGVRNITATVCALLVMLDNAQIAQTRLILLDAPLVLFMLLSLYCYIKFYQQRYHDFTPRWWAWLALTGLSLALTVSCKLIGVFAFLTIGGAVLWDLWNLLDIKRRIPMRKVAKHFCARVLFLLLIPLVIYVSWFWVHFAILTRSGTGDAFMSAEFQQTLEGNDLLESSLELHAFDSITLKHRGTNVYLHSHSEHYPHKYDDGRISSDGQQVTGYPHEDVNNSWQIVPVSPVDNDDGSFNVTRRCIYHMQHIRLLHQSTNTYLLTHDVAAPLTPTNEEITTIPADELHANQDIEQNTLWELHIEGGIEGKTTWHTHRSWIRLVHVPTRVAVWTYAKGELPSWGFRQQEVNGNKNALDKTAIWTVNSVHVDPNSPMFDLRSRPPEPRSLQSLPFLDKFAELQLTMLDQNNRLTQSHPYASRPMMWPFLLQGVSYWSSDPERRQIFFIGNPVTWWGGILAISVFAMLFTIDLLLLRRGIDQIPHAIRHRTLRTTGFFAFAWACHYLPFFLMGRQLFLHHYLPAHICAVMVLGGMLDFFTSDTIDFPLSNRGPSLTPDRIRASMRQHRSMSHLMLVMLLLALTIGFTLYLAPLTYGHQLLTPEQANARKLLADWQLQYLK